MEELTMNKNLKAEIIRQFGSQAEFALKAGIEEAVISRVIHGRRQLDEAEQNRWAKLLKVQPERVFGSDEGRR